MADKGSTPGSSTIHVEIFGQTYTVKAGTDPGYVEELAAHVDAQMHEVGKAAGAVDSVRVAVLAALNIADECFRLRRQVREADERAAQRAEGLLRELSTVLGE
jgi:cell division protein ZapA